jgi:hypothetical protein
MQSGNNKWNTWGTYSITGVATDCKKTEAVNNWPIPQALKELRGFLGLAGYYRKFIRHFGVISKPLTKLLKKNNFGWNDQSQQAFDRLKKALCEAPVLALPDFSKTFVLETDACDYGLGAVLSQECRPIAYFSKALSPKHMGLSIYEKRVLGHPYGCGEMETLFRAGAIYHTDGS